MNNPQTKPSAHQAWEGLERLAKVLSLVAIPVVVAVVGWLIQGSLADRNVSQQYVQLAVSILKEPKDNVDATLRDWAVDLLNQNSPTKFSPQVIDALKRGEAIFPLRISSMLSSGGSFAIAPDDRTVATGNNNGSFQLWDVSTGMVILSVHSHEDAVTAIAFSPDASRLATGSLDRTAKMWDRRNGQELMHFRGHAEGVIGIAFSPDGATLWTRSLDGTLRSWSTNDGREISVIAVPKG